MPMICRIAAVRDALVTTALVVGPPVLLITLTGPPLPRQWPSVAAVQAWADEPLHPSYAAGTARTIAWLVWAALAAAVLAALSGRLRQLPAQLRRMTTFLPPPVQGLTATMVGAAAVTTVAAPAAATDTAAPAAAVDTTPRAGSHLTTATLAPAATSYGAKASPLSAVTTPAEHPRSARPRQRPTCVVRPGDTLFDLAAQHLGDGGRWPEIYALNRGTRFPAVGGALTDPDLIYPGWTLDLPDDADGGKPQAPAPAEERRPSTGAEAPPGGPTAAPPPAPTPPKASVPPPSTPATATPTPSGSAPTAHPDDDGVAEPAPTSPPSSAAHPTAGIPSTRPPGATADARDANPAQRRQGVSLPGGSWIDISLAVAIMAAVALIWAHRRRRYIPRGPSALPRLDDPDLAPMPAVVHQIRRRLRHRFADDEPATTATGNLPDSDGHVAGQPTPDRHVADAEHDGEPPSGASPTYDTGADDRVIAASSPDSPGTPTPMASALNHPLIDGWPPAGLGLTGPGADAAARGLLVAALVAGGLHQPDARTEVVIPSATATTLLGTTRLPHTPRLVVTSGLDDALQLIESQTLHRTRALHSHDVDDLPALRTADPYTEPFPPLLLIADATGHRDRTRIAAQLAQGQRLDIHGVLLGAWPDGTTLTVAADGTTTPADDHTAHHDHHLADIDQLTVLNAGETADLITALAESHTGQCPPSASTGSAPQPPATLSEAAPPSDDPGNASPSVLTGQASLAAGASRTGELSPTGTRPAAPAIQEHQHPTAPNGQHGPVHGQAPDAPATGTDPVDVTVLGRPAIVGADPQRSLRAKSMELLVYLAVQDGAAAVENILDDLLPDAPASKAVHRLHTYISDLRAVLRHNAGPGTYITHPGHRYVLNPDRFDIDLWHMRAALRDARTADTDQTRIAALRRAFDAYSGPLAGGCDYEWIEPYREGVRRQALDASLALGELLAEQPADQLTVLETAMDHHPYAEPLYQAAMRAHAALGQLDAVRGLRRTLTRRLAEIDAEPGNDSLSLADELVTALQRPQSRARLQRVAGAGDGAAA
jgi:DNA-binding SARP family transcriptional activator